jgi:SAM-dependent methyltransferase
MSSNAYERVAAEYHNRLLHPTCANLRDASRHGFSLLAQAFFRDGHNFCEVGCGEGMLGQMSEVEGRRIVSTDSSPAMLRQTSGQVIQAEASDLPFGDESFDGVFGSLADPYNQPPFYKEALRVLRKGGRLLFSVPDVRWVRFNQHREGVAEPVAILRLSDGTAVTLSSHVYEVKEQINLILAAGFSDVWSRSIIWTELPHGGAISHRFFNQSGLLVSEAAVTMYLATK